MPLYEYKSEDGRVIERVYTMAEDKPEKITEGGVEYTRVWGNARVNDRAGESNQYPYASLRNKHIFKNDPTVEKRTVTIKGIVHHDVPIVKSQAHERNLASRYGLTRE